MKKCSMLLISAVIWLLMTLCACQSSTAHLRITSSTWNGWDGILEQTVTDYTVQASDTLSFSGICELKITILSVSGKSIRFKTNTPMSSSADGIDLKTDQKSFVLKKGTPLELITPTLDAGDIYTLELVS